MRRSVGFVAVLTGAVALMASAGTSVAWGDDDTPKVVERRNAGLYQVEGEFTVNAPAAIAWTVLSDYDHLSRFLSEMRRSVVHERHGDRLLVEQEALGRVMFFSRVIHLLLEVEQQGRRAISFRDVSGREFEKYAGSWTLTPVDEGTHVVYRLQARPRADVPELIVSAAIEHGAELLLTEVRTEMIRRASLPDVRTPGSAL